MNMFEIKDKVALITGGSRGIGASYANALLKHGIKGITIADINVVEGKNTVEKLNKIYGENRALFINTDVSDIEQFDKAFKATIDKFGHIDILINNAGVLNESNWKRLVDVNLIGTINGFLLGFEKYLKKYKSSSEAVILSTSSIGAVKGAPHVPIYGGTKAAVNGMTLSWGNELHYNRTKIRVLSICPGATATDLVKFDLKTDLLSPEYADVYNSLNFEWQKPEIVAEEAVEIIKSAPNGTIWIVDEGKKAVKHV